MAESLGVAVLDLSTDGSGLERGLGDAEGTTKSRMGRIGGVIGKATKAAAAGFAAAGAASIAAAFKTASYGDEVAKTATKLGVGVEELQEMRVWADRNGISAQALDRAVGRLNQRIGRAIDGNEKYASAFEELDVAITDSQGNARDTNEVMGETIAKLSEIEDPALQSARASEIFGTKMARDLMPALQDGSLSMEEAAELAHELGVVMDEESAAAAEEFSDSWANIKDAVGGFMRQAAIPVMRLLNDKVFPVIQDGIVALRHLWDVFSEGEGIVDGIRGVFESLGQSGGEMFGGLLEAVQGVFSQIVDWLASGGITQIATALMEARQRLLDAAMVLFPAILDAAIEFIPQLLEWITGELIPQVLELIVSGVPLLLDAAVTLFESLVAAIVEVLPVLLETLLGEVLPSLLDTIVSMVPQLLDAGVTAFLALVDAIVDVLPDLLGTLLGTVLPKLVTTIIGMLPDLLKAGIEAFMALVLGIVEVLPEIVTTLLTVVLPELITTLIGMIPELIETGIEVFLALVEAIIEALPEIVSTIATDLVPAIIDGVMQLGPELLNAGKELMSKLADGIKNGIGAVKDAAGNVASNIRGALPFSPAEYGPLRKHPPEEGGQNVVEMIAAGMGRVDLGVAMERVVAPVAAGVHVDGGGGGVSLDGQRLRLVVNGREFDAYLDDSFKSNRTAEARQSRVRAGGR